jgi:hypothetical protein
MEFKELLLNSPGTSFLPHSEPVPPRRQSESPEQAPPQVLGSENYPMPQVSKGFLPAETLPMGQLSRTLSSKGKQKKHHPVWSKSAWQDIFHEPFEAFLAAWTLYSNPTWDD